ncbi:MAG: AsmA-like C-terminal region-containing protein, partial [Pseudomonadota bacterium]
EHPDPRGIPALQVRIGDLRVNGLELGRLGLYAQPTDNGMRVTQASLSTESSEFQGTGEWTFINASQHRSNFEVVARADDLAALLNRFDVEDAVSGGQTEIRLLATWPGAPSEFSLAEVEGNASVRIRDGRLLNVKRGLIGRVFSLLSIQNIFRLLLLDFGELGKGFPYDAADGKFRIENGRAVAETFRVSAATAQLTVSGYTDLAAGTYHHLVTVTPKLTSILPLAPIDLVERLLRRRLINDAFSAQYALDGPWENPSVTPVNVDKTPTTTSGELR